MADRKTEKMAEFYTQCQKKGYTNMRDDTQALKAKVIATDLGLNYGNIVSFYEKAKACREEIEKEKAAERALREKRQVAGEELVTLQSGDEKTQVKVYIRPDGSKYYTVNDGGKVEGVPGLNIKEGGALLLTYHPSQAVYMSVSYGGVTTGGVHHTTSGYTANTTKSGKGDIEIVASGKSFTLATASFSDYTCKRFRYDKAFRNWVSDKTIKCYLPSEKADFYYSTIKTGRLNYEQMTYALTAAADEMRLSYVDCERIVDLLGRVIHGLFPPTVEELYAAAIAAEENVTARKDATSAELQQVIEMFSDIFSYKDASAHAGRLRKKCAEVQQTEKEQAVLKKEKNKKVLLVVGILLLIAVIAVAVVANQSANKPYREMESAMDSGEFSAAWVKDHGYSSKLRSEKGFQLVAKKLGELHSDDRPEEALRILAEAFKIDNFYMDNDKIYASAAFVDWIEASAQRDGTRVENSNYNVYRAYGYEINWDSRSVQKHFSLYEVMHSSGSESTWFLGIVTVKNSYSKTPASPKVEIP